MLVADSEDGKPLAPTAGPLRLIVPSDKSPARWVRMVKAIRVVANPFCGSIENPVPPRRCSSNILRVHSAFTRRAQ